MDNEYILIERKSEYDFDISVSINNIDHDANIDNFVKALDSAKELILKYKSVKVNLSH